MRRRSLSLILLALLLAVAACSKGIKQEDVNPFTVDRTRIAAIDVVAVAPVMIPDGMPDAERIEAWFDVEIEAKLHEGGFSVLYPHEYVMFWDEAVEKVGGLADASGARDHGKTAQAMTLVLQRLDFIKHVDAFFVPTVRVVEAPFAGGSAYWDGTKQSIKSGNPMREFLAGSPDGTVGALSLQVTLFDARANILYERGGGIEVLSTMQAKEFVLVPRNQLLTNQERMREAIAIAIDPLTD